MSLEHESFSLKQISSDLAYMGKWLNEKGICTTNNRFSETKENMQTISNYYDLGKLDDLPSIWGNDKIIASIIEATSFVNIYKAFKDFKDHRLPRNSLKKVVEGPYLSQEEDSVTNESRNYLFELELAVYFISKGINLLDFDDISFEFDNIVWNIQCKRPMNERNIDFHIEKAVRQGIRFFDTKKSKLVTRGIIAISIDKILGLDKIVIKTPSTDSLKIYIDNKLDEFVRQNEHKWDKKIDNRFLAVFIFMRVLVEIRNPLTLGPVRYTGIVHLLSPSTHKVEDAMRIKSLAKLVGGAL